MEFFQLAWIALVVLVFSAWLWSRFSIAGARVAPAGQTVLDIEMEGAADRAVEEARERYQIELDGTRNSLELLDEHILATLHSRHTAGALDDAEFSRNAVLWGAYLGEVMRREGDGAAHWQRDSALGPETFPLVYGGGEESFPCGWCVQRIKNGPAPFPKPPDSNPELRDP